MSALTERTEDGMEVYLSEIHECLDEFIRDRGVEDMEKPVRISGPQRFVLSVKTYSKIHRN